MTEIPDIGRLREGLVSAGNLAERGARPAAIARVAWGEFGLLGGVAAGLKDIAAWAPLPSCFSSFAAQLPDMDELYVRLLGADEHGECGDVGPLTEVAWQLLALLETTAADLRSRRACLQSASFVAA